ncbi:MAG: lysine 2,3-aminomutase, partial [Deltaproteobacteria bacterium]|nr:lysine 2,3-aminomutase [Deltaproteobacteria bacterium]
MITTLKTDHAMESWEQILSKSITTPEDLATRIEIDEREITHIISRYPMCINPYYLSLIKNKGDGIFKQAIPDIREITEENGFGDPLNEEALSPVPGLTHKYPD